MAEDIKIVDQVLEIDLIPREEFERIRRAGIDLPLKLSMLADMNRINALSAVKRAGSGHLGSSLSASDIFTYLYNHEMNTVQVGVDSPNRDIFFSSKGHDVPGLYSVLYSTGIISQDKLLHLRRLGGLDGHPDVGITGIEANTGSLGMGISKGKGMALAKRLQKHGGRVFVMVGDGEFQEGQNYEGLHSAAHLGVGNLFVIMDHNKVQSDKYVSEIMDLGDLETIVKAMGWVVRRCDGNDMAALLDVFEFFKTVPDRPKFLIADTIKGRGVSFMEHPAAMKDSRLYPWHAGAPDDEAYTAGVHEILIRLGERFNDLGQPPLTLQRVEPHPKAGPGTSDEVLADAYGKALIDLAAARKDLVVLDGDLSADCRVRGFEAAYPERFIEVGIAEQDMVSTACGLAGQGMLPVVNSFSSFLISRANEQIYNAATEKRKIIYGCHFAGLIPAGPGKSHQSLRDVSLLAALPDMEIIQPCSALEARLATEYAVNTAEHSVALRMNIGPSPRKIVLPDGYQLVPGRGAALTEGHDAILFSYGPVMLHEALLAAETLEGQGFGLAVVNMPWLNRVDTEWLAGVLGDHRRVVVLEDHYGVGGLGDRLLRAMAEAGLHDGRNFEVISVEGWPGCGTPVEVLAYHRLNGASLAERLGAAR